MSRTLMQPQSVEGVFGPEILLSTVTGKAYRRSESDDAQTASSERLTNAFCVWASTLVLVVSSGVEPILFPTAAESLRNIVGDPGVPILFMLGDSGVERAVSDVKASTSRKQLAKALAYVRVQCAWHDGPELSVVVDDTEFRFQVAFVPEGNKWRPQVS
ncbi:MAG: hypothetical protein SFV15_23570 [Polyangiaceae bacterium]|nr:hypothetical protein [Polyangiaceae bacterium]